jgi:hypothetical protein
MEREIAQQRKRDCLLGISGKEQLLEAAQWVLTLPGEMASEGGHETGMVAPAA